MKKIETDDLKPGMITARPVTTGSGQLIINSGVVLDKKLIARIDFYSIGHAYIESDEPQPQPVKQPQPVEQAETTDTSSVVEKKQPVEHSSVIHPSYSQKVKRSSKFQNFQLEYSKKISNVKSSIDCLANAEQIDSKTLLAETMDLLSGSNLTTIELFDILHNMRQINDSVYAHSLNVALISRVLAKWLHMSNEECNLVTIAGLVHDVGKTKIPSSILNKPGKLTSEELAIARMHPKLGYDSIKNLNLDDQIKKVVLMHHERADGSGYPLGVSGDKIDTITTVIAIADVYDAMTAARSYRGPLCPFAVISSFEENGLQKYNPHIILTFLERIANTYQNNRVMLSDGRQGTVILLNKDHLSKPIVELDNGQFLDLSTNLSVHIVSVM